MTVSATTRKAGPYLGNGSTKEFSFPFKVFQASDVFVAKTSDNGEVELTLNTDYTVRLNSNQDTTAGGVVVLTNPLEDGQYLSVISQIEYDQLAIFTNKGGFYPETLNDCYDKLTILCQQLVEELDRCVKLDITDTMTAAELKQRLLDAATYATELAKQYMESAKASATTASELVTTATTLVNTFDERVEEGKTAVANEATKTGDEQVARLIAEGDTQVARIEADVDQILIDQGTGCGECQWVVSEAITAGTEITIPSSLAYVVGRHHLKVFYNGLTCFIDRNFAEVGNTDTKSNKFTLTFDVKAGDELDVWVAALGKADVTSAITTATAANDAVAELSQKVVYKDETSSSS